MLSKIKSILSMNSLQLGAFLGITQPTLRKWERDSMWPLWALEKCGIMDTKEHQTIGKIRELLDEH